VRLPCAYAGAASVAAAAVAPTPTVELFKKERRSIKSPPDFFFDGAKNFFDRFGEMTEAKLTF
jgi:hypothetical protein